MTVLQTVDTGMLPARRPDQAMPGSGPLVVTAGGQGQIQLAGQLTATYELIYETNPTCGAVVNKLVKQVATIPLGVYDRPGVEEAPELVKGHPLNALLARPAPRKGPSYWKQGLARDCMIHGNGLLAKFRGSTGVGEPINLLAASWPWIAAYAQLGGDVEWWSTFQTGQQRFFNADDGVHMAWASGNLNGLGVSPLKQLAQTVQLDDAARRYQVANFVNGARPSSAIVPPDGFTYKDGQRDELRAQIAQMHGGPDKAGLIALLAPGFKWEGLGHTAVEAEVVAARSINRQEIAMVYDVPPPMIGDLEHGTYSNVEELHRILYVTTLRPWLALIEEVIQRQLIDAEPAWGDVYVQFDLSEILRGNRREEIDAMSQSYLNGITTLNEVRNELGYKRLDIADADVPHIQANNLKPMGAGSSKGLVEQT